MKNDEANKYLMAILTAALETEPAHCPETMVYLAIGADFTKWQFLKSLLSGAGLATFEGHSLRLTDKGREMARKINAFIKAA